MISGYREKNIGIGDLSMLKRTPTHCGDDPSCLCMMDGVAYKPNER